MKFADCFSFFLLIAGLECSKILVLFPTVSKSHIMPLQALAISLAERGHEITFMSTFPLGKEVKNLREILIPFKESDKEAVLTMLDPAKGGSSFKRFPIILNLVTKTTNETMQMKEMKRLMKEESFDLVIVGYFFLTESMLGVADHFKCPSILFSPAGAFSIINEAMGNPMAVSGTPHLMAPVKQMDFLGRLKTFVASGLEKLVLQYFKYRSKQVYK